MSLAMYASEYNNNEPTTNIQKKKNSTTRKTLKRREEVKQTNPKLQAMVKKMYEHDEEDDTDDNYAPLANPISASGERIDNSMENDSTENDSTEYDMNEPAMNSQQMSSESVSQEAFTQLPSEYAKQYYQQSVPYFNQSSDDLTPNGVNKDDLLTKLNQIIYLLEEQQDENTGHVTEELILYSFLGIFMIFIVDSFARVGKYVR
jgi:hypothetical protein